MDNCKCKFQDYHLYKTFLTFLHSQDSHAQNQINNLLIYYSSTERKLSIQTLVEEMKFIVIDEDEFDHRDMSLLLAVLSISSPLEFRCTEHNQWHFHCNFVARKILVKIKWLQ